jgi:low temperature requirement protein LtrA
VDQRAPEEVVSVSTLELFFDLVFVFTITQLTTVLVAEPTVRGAAQVVLMLGVIWWMYGGYAWLTNVVPPTSGDRRLLLLGGMCAFLIVALAIPKAFGDDGVAFGIAYGVVVLVHTVTFTRAASASIVQAVLRLAPFNLTTAALVLAGGIAGGDAQYVLWALAFLCEWLTPLVNDPGDFDISSSHFVERHGLVLIVALGESVVAIGIGAAGLELDAGLAAVAILALLLTACLWWLYFGGDDEAAERALAAAPQPRRPMLAIYSFGYAQLAMLLGVIAAAAGTKKAIGHPFDALEIEPALMLGAGVALFVAAEVGFRLALAIEPRALRALAAALALATIPLGLGVSAAVQIGALAALLAATLALEHRAAAAGATRAAPRSP